MVVLKENIIYFTVTWLEVGEGESYFFSSKFIVYNPTMKFKNIGNMKILDLIKFNVIINFKVLQIFNNTIRINFIKHIKY